MSDGNRPRSQQVGEPRKLQLPEIESGFSALWKQVSASAGAPMAMRVCTFNLVAYLEDPGAIDYAVESTRSAFEIHPMRSVILRVVRSEEGKTEGQLAGYCQLSETGTVQVCCEQVILDVSGKGWDELGSTVDELLVPDLPVVVWWIGGLPFGKEGMHRLEQITDFLIVDTQDFSNLQQELATMLSEAGKLKRLGLGDLNWSRLTPWRESIAGLFDPEETRRCLQNVDQVCIEYVEGQGSSPVRAILLAGWFVSRLRWSVTGRNDSHQGAYSATVKDGSGKDIIVKINPVQSTALRPGDIAAVHMEVSSGAASFKITSAEGSRFSVCTEGAAVTPVCRTMEYPMQSPGDLIAEQIETMDYDPVYREAVDYGLRLTATADAQRPTENVIW